MTEQTRAIWVIDPIHTRIRFEAKYLMLTTVSGWFREIEGTVETDNANFSNSSIRLIIYTNSLFTGIDERDNHLRSPDFFDVKKYPTIQFQSSSVGVDGANVSMKGTLSIKDTVQEMEFTAQYLGQVKDPGGNTKAAFEMDMVFDRKDFNITWNQFFDKQGILVSDRVQVHCDVQLLRLN